MFLKKLFLLALLASFALALEQSAVLASFSFSNSGLALNQAEFGSAELPNYSLPQEKPLFVRYYSGSRVTKELVVKDPRYTNHETAGPDGVITSFKQFNENAKMQLVLPLVAGSCVVTLYDSANNTLLSFNSCTLAEQKQEDFYSFTNLKKRDLDYFVLVTSAALSLILLGVIITRMRK